MASLHKDPRKKSPYWYAAYITPDRVRHFKSTKVTDKAKAWQIANAWAKSTALGSKLTPQRAREIIASGVADIMAVSGETLPSENIGKWFDRWLEIKELENETGTHSRYCGAIESFKTYLGSKVEKDLGTLTVDMIMDYRDKCAKSHAIGTVNTNLKIIRACLSAAAKRDLIADNVASKVSELKERGESKRRALTLVELQTILKTCADTPWRGLVLLALYTGQRMGDCARLTWQQVDLQKKEVWFLTEKTGKRLSMSLAEPLEKYLAALPSVDNGSEYVFPTFADMVEKKAAPLSNAFAAEVLIPAGLMSPRAPKHVSTGKGRTGKRQVNPVTFHSLRHSFVTMLKATGASNAMAQMIVGHDSASVSDRYTHLSAGDTVDSITKLPDITKLPEDKKKG